MLTTIQPLSKVAPAEQIAAVVADWRARYPEAEVTRRARRLAARIRTDMAAGKARLEALGAEVPAMLEEPAGEVQS